MSATANLPDSQSLVDALAEEQAEDAASSGGKARRTAARPIQDFGAWRDHQEANRRKSAGEAFAKAILATAPEALTRRPPLRRREP
jgi:hypothetical protein